MSFWSELSTPIKAVAVVGAVLIVAMAGYLITSGGDEEATQQRGLAPAGAAP